MPRVPVGAVVALRLTSLTAVRQNRPERILRVAVPVMDFVEVLGADALGASIMFGSQKVADLVEEVVPARGAAEIDGVEQLFVSHRFALSLPCHSAVPVRGIVHEHRYNLRSVLPPPCVHVVHYAILRIRYGVDGSVEHIVPPYVALDVTIIAVRVDEADA